VDKSSLKFLLDFTASEVFSERMETALLFAIALVLGGGVCGGLLSAWSVHRRVRSLELRQADLEAALLRIVKQKAAAARWEKPKVEDEILELMKKQKTPGTFDNEFFG